MLYDPKWAKPETKADPYALETLIAWLEQQPKDKTFCKVIAADCLLGQYFQAMGLPDHAAKSAMLGNYTTHFGRVAGLDMALRWGTYGEALQRARGLAAQQS